MLHATDGAIRKGYAETSYGQLHYRYMAPAHEARAGLPVAFFGAVPRSTQAAKELQLALGTDRIAIALDPPVYGDSDRPDAPLASALDFAAIFAAGLEALGIDRFGVFGDHSGAILALAMGACRPARVGNVVVGATAYLIDRELRVQRAGR